MEILLWEESIGFESFNTICDRVYEEVTSCEINSIEELEDFVAEHSKYLQLITRENGDYTLETQSYNNSFKGVINEDRIFLIGNNAYKVYDDFFVVAEKDYVKDLKNLPLKFFNSETLSEHFEIISIDRMVKKGIASCGAYDDDEAINNDAKRKVEAYHLVERFHVIDNYNQIYLTYARWYYHATSYEKWLGVWRKNKTKWSWDIDVNWHQSHNGGTNYPETTAHTYTSSDPESKTASFEHGVLVDMAIVYPSVYFNNYDCSIWTRGTTPSYKAVFSCP